jgi:lysophospholipase L1-like esterase
LPIEIFLRNKYRNYESNTYRYTIDNFNPFLQSQIAQQENLTVNSLGFRGEEISAIKPKGTYRIAVLGGSTVLNREVPFEQNAVRLLEKKLRKQFPNRKIEVINAGKDYYTSEHSLIQYMFKIADLNPDLVIMWHGANDVGASCTLEGVVSHGEYKSDYSHMFGAVANIVFNYFRPQPVIQIKLVTLDFAVKIIVDNLFSDITNAFKDVSRDQAAKDFIENKNTVSVHDYPSLEAYKRNLLYFIEFTNKEKIPLILGNQPSLLLKKDSTLNEVKAIMYPTIICRKNGKYYDLNSLKYGMTLFNKETQTVAQENNVMFVDLASQIPENLSYFFDGFHYTEKGNEQIANLLFNFIVSKQLIPRE